MKSTHCVLFVSLVVLTGLLGCSSDVSPASEANQSDAAISSDGFLGGQDGQADCVESGERCDGIDNDCDGSVDEDFQVGVECVATLGGCTAAGLWACNTDGMGASCVTEDFPMEEEVCDEADNDCDGLIDETFTLARDLNHCGACDARCELEHAVHDCVGGECIIQSCLDGFVDINEDHADGCECAISDSGEACNDIDDDCDGSVDEALNLGSPCSVGAGTCLRTGELSCGGEGEVLCNAEPGMPSVESCNGLDDDCDGAIDEDFDGDDDGAVRCPDIDCLAPCPDGVDCAVICSNYDCNDEAPTINPNAIDHCEDGIDQNCDGVDSECVVQVARVTDMVFPGRDEENCRDLDGDGVPDNAFAVIAPIINATITRDINNLRLNQMGIIYGLNSSVENRRFDFGLALASSRGGAFSLSGETLDEAGRPLNFFGGASVEDGVLSAGPRDIIFTVPVVGDAVIALPIRRTMVQGQLTLPVEEDGQTGFRLENGWVTGVVREDEFRERALPLLSPEFVVLVDQLFQPDIDSDGDGEDDSFGMCVGVTMAPSGLLEPPAPLRPPEE